MHGVDTRTLCIDAYIAELLYQNLKDFCRSYAGSKIKKRMMESETLAFKFQKTKSDVCLTPTLDHCTNLFTLEQQC